MLRTSPAPIFNARFRAVIKVDGTEAANEIVQGSQTSLTLAVVAAGALEVLTVTPVIPPARARPATRWKCKCREVINGTIP